MAHERGHQAQFYEAFLCIRLEVHLPLWQPLILFVVVFEKKFNKRKAQELEGVHLKGYCFDGRALNFANTLQLLRRQVATCATTHICHPTSQGPLDGVAALPEMRM